VHRGVGVNDEGSFTMVHPWIIKSDVSFPIYLRYLTVFRALQLLGSEAIDKADILSHRRVVRRRVLLHAGVWGPDYATTRALLYGSNFTIYSFRCVGIVPRSFAIHNRASLWTMEAIVTRHHKQCHAAYYASVLAELLCRHQSQSMAQEVLSVS
jgi:hypothetical protein